MRGGGGVIHSMKVVSWRQNKARKKKRKKTDNQRPLHHQEGFLSEGERLKEPTLEKKNTTRAGEREAVPFVLALRNSGGDQSRRKGLYKKSHCRGRKKLNLGKRFNV